MEDNRLNNNVRILVEEAAATEHSPRWYEAQAEASRIHPSLPDIITKAAMHLPGSSTEPRETAFRIGDAAIREVAAAGQTNLDNVEEMILARRVFRSVLIQEGAAEILRSRAPGQGIDDFMGLKNALTTDRNGLGVKSLEVLQKQMNLDLRGEVRKLDTIELRALSVGSYDRINPELRKTVSKALEVSPEELGSRYPAAQIGNNINRQPFMRHPRTQMQSQTPAGFGKKISIEARMQQQASGISR